MRSIRRTSARGHAHDAHLELGTGRGVPAPRPRARAQPAGCATILRARRAAATRNTNSSAVAEHRESDEADQAGLVHRHLEGDRTCRLRHSPDDRLEDRPSAPRRYAQTPMAEPFTVLIMAAGQGTRMQSLAPEGPAPRLRAPDGRAGSSPRPREAGARARSSAITRPGDGVAEGLPDDVEVAEQTEGEGTGAAVLAARDLIDRDGTVLVLSGDHPLIAAELIEGLVATHEAEQAKATLLTTEPARPRRLRPHRARRRRRASSDRRDQAHRRRARGGPRHPRDQHRHLRLRRRRSLFDAPRQGGRAERRALPHRRLPADARRGRPDRPLRDRRRVERAWA